MATSPAEMLTDALEAITKAGAACRGAIAEGRAVTFRVEGKPRGKARTRKYGRILVTPAQTVSHERQAAWEAKAAAGGMVFGQGVPLAVIIRAFMPRPKKGAKAFHIGAPDADNISKIILDALNGVLWHDDAQVVEVFASRRYSDEKPHVIVTVYEVTEP